jgi:hypothetical protein
MKHHQDADRMYNANKRLFGQVYACIYQKLLVLMTSPLMLPGGAGALVAL